MREPEGLPNVSGHLRVGTRSTPQGESSTCLPVVADGGNSMQSSWAPPAQQWNDALAKGAQSFFARIALGLRPAPVTTTEPRSVADGNGRDASVKAPQRFRAHRITPRELRIALRAFPEACVSESWGPSGFTAWRIASKISLRWRARCFESEGLWLLPCGWFRLSLTLLAELILHPPVENSPAMREDRFAGIEFPWRSASSAAVPAYFAIREEFGQ